MIKTNTDDINIVEYNPDWVRQAEDEISKLNILFRDQNWVVDIQHIGSTAVPGLAAKPIIDIYIGISSLREGEAVVQPLEGIGYQFWRDNPNKEKMFFVKGMPPFGTGRTHHIHVVKFDSDYWKARLLFRDYLRCHPEEKLIYTKIKDQLMKKFKNNREAYTDGKTEYISSVLKKAGFN